MLLIATPRSAFKTCRPDEELSIVVARNNEGFDYFPVVEYADGSTRERIIGLVEVIPFTHGVEPRGLVREQMRPLSEENLIGADASLLTFIRDADRQMCRLVVSGPEISGLVSLSDLQRLPVRAASVRDGDASRNHHGPSHPAVNSIGQRIGSSRLSAQRKSKVSTKDAAEAKIRRHLRRSTLLYTQFCDKVTIVRKSPNFSWSKTSFDADLGKVQSLRDDLAHANDYAATRGAAGHVCETVRLMDQWIDRLCNLANRPGRFFERRRQLGVGGAGPRAFAGEDLTALSPC